MLLDAVSDDPAALSYLVASAALLTTEDRQALLAESATRRRLAAESRLLRRELTLLQDARRRPRAAAPVRHADDRQLRRGPLSGRGALGRHVLQRALVEFRRRALRRRRGGSGRVGGPAEVVAVQREDGDQVGEQRREGRERQGRRASRASSDVVTTFADVGQLGLGRAGAEQLAELPGDRPP